MEYCHNSDFGHFYFSMQEVCTFDANFFEKIVTFVASKLSARGQFIFCLWSMCTTFSHNFKNITQNGQNHSCDTIALKRRIRLGYWYFRVHLLRLEVGIKILWWKKSHLLFHFKASLNVIMDTIFHNIFTYFCIRVPMMCNNKYFLNWTNDFISLINTFLYQILKIWITPSPQTIFALGVYCISDYIQ